MTAAASQMQSFLLYNCATVALFEEVDRTSWQAGVHHGKYSRPTVICTAEVLTKREYNQIAWAHS